VIAVVSETERDVPVVRQATEIAQEAGLDLIFYDIEAPPSPLESPLPTNWSGEGEQQLFANRLRANDLEAAGRGALADLVSAAERSGLAAFGWLPAAGDDESLAGYAASERAEVVVVHPDHRDLTRDVAARVDLVGATPPDR
jgi:hypothetical protein